MSQSTQIPPGTRLEPCSPTLFTLAPALMAGDRTQVNWFEPTAGGPRGAAYAPAPTLPWLQAAATVRPSAVVPDETHPETYTPLPPPKTPDVRIFSDNPVPVPAVPFRQYKGPGGAQDPPQIGGRFVTAWPQPNIRWPIWGGGGSPSGAG